MDIGVGCNNHALWEEIYSSVLIVWTVSLFWGRTVVDSCQIDRWDYLVRYGMYRRWRPTLLHDHQWRRRLQRLWKSKGYGNILLSKYFHCHCFFGFWTPPYWWRRYWDVDRYGNKAKVRSGRAWWQDSEGKWERVGTGVGGWYFVLPCFWVQLQCGQFCPPRRIHGNFKIDPSVAFIIQQIVFIDEFLWYIF